MKTVKTLLLLYVMRKLNIPDKDINKGYRFEIIICFQKFYRHDFDYIYNPGE